MFTTSKTAMGGSLNSCPGKQVQPPNPAPTPPFIGIDLGCSHSAVAVYLGNGNVEVIPNDIGNRTTPSVVAFLGQERLVGEAAVVQAAMNPLATVRNIKRILGRSFQSIMDEKFPALGATITLIEKGVHPLLVLKHEDAAKHANIRPEEVAAMLLSSLKKSAEQFLKKEVPEASIAVPAYFNAAQRLAVQQSGVIAGFKRVRLVNDTSATALTFALDRAGTRTVVVVDIGGGGGSVSVVEASLNGYVKVLASSGHRVPGGDDLDARVLADFEKEIFGTFDHLSDERTSEILLSSWTKAKEKLIHRQQTTMKMFVPGINRDFEKVLKWEDFLDHLKPMLESVENALSDVLKESGRLKNHVNDVLLVGGCSRIPLLRSAVRNFFDGKEPCRAVNADEGVACGAALYAASLSRDGSVESVLEDITPLGMRIKSNKEGTFNVVKRNQPVPCKIEQEMRDFLSRPARYFEVEQSGTSGWKLVCKVRTPPPCKRLSRLPMENVHFLSHDGLLSLNMGLPRDAKYELEVIACLPDHGVQILTKRIEKYFQTEDDRNRINEEKNRVENLIRDMQTRQAQFGENEVKAKQTLKEVVDPAMEWFRSDQASSSEEYRERYSKIVNNLIGCEADLPDTREWRDYLRELKNSCIGNESGDSEKKRPRLDEPDRAEVHAQRAKLDKEPPKNVFGPTGGETRQSKLNLERLENSSQAQQPRVAKPDSKPPGNAANSSQAQQPRVAKPDSKPPGNAASSSQAQQPGVANPDLKLPGNAANSSQAQQRCVANPDLKPPGNAASSSQAQQPRVAKPDSKLTGDTVKSCQSLPRETSHGSKPSVDRSTKPAQHSEISEQARRQGSRPRNEQGSSTSSEGRSKKSKDDGEASGAAAPEGGDPTSAAQVAASSRDGQRVALGDVLSRRLTVEEQARRALRSVMWQVREAGTFCLMLYTITTERGDFVAMMLRYCTPGFECSPVERLVALLDAGGVTAAALHGRFTELCNLYHVDWRSALLAVSMDAVRSTYGEFWSLHKSLQVEAGRAIPLVWDSANSLGNLLMAMGFEKLPAGKKFFVDMDCFRDLFRHEGQRADLARHCGVRVKEVEFTSYEDTVLFISKHLKEVREFLGLMKDMYNAVPAARLCECLIDIDFVAILLTLDQVFTATKTLTECLKDTHQNGLTSALNTIVTSSSPCLVDQLAYSIYKKLGDLLESVNAKYNNEGWFGSRFGLPEFINHVLYTAKCTIRNQLFYCYDMLTDIHYLGQILIFGGMKMPPTNFLNWHPLLQGERLRSILFSEMRVIHVHVSSGVYNYQTISHSSILRSPSFPLVAFGLRALLTLPLLPAEQGSRKVVELRRCLQLTGANHLDLETNMILSCASGGGQPQEHDADFVEIVKKFDNL